MLSLRARIFIIISLAVLFILGVSIFLWVKSKDKTATNGNGSETVTTNGGAVNQNAVKPVIVSNVTNLQVQRVSDEETQKKAVQNLAKIFVERLNSYSSGSKFQNVRDVESMVTSNYWKQLSAKISASGGVISADNFFAISVLAYGSKLMSFDNDKATVEVQAKMSEEKGGAVNKKDVQAIVNLVKTNGEWLVDSFSWKQ
jgi:gamma-glutamylcysteine synthetase